MDNLFSKVKQPTPNIASTTADGQCKNYKVIEGPKIGVIKLPKLSSTPLRDMVEIKRKENPYILYKPKNNKYTIKGFETVASIAVVLCGIISLIKLKKK